MKNIFVIILLLYTGVVFSQGTYFYGMPNTICKTGQTTVYVTNDDASYQIGQATTPRLVDNGNGTISDKATGLMWVKDPIKIIPGASVIASNQVQVAHGNWAVTTSYAIGDLINDAVGSTGRYVCCVAHTSGSSTLAADITAHSTYWRLTVWAANATTFSNAETLMDWPTAITNCEALDYAGYTDWRMPNIKELLSTMDFSQYDPCIYITYFPNISDYYPWWSSTTYMGSTTYAYSIDYGGGSMSKYLKTVTQYVLPVRGGK